MLMRLENAVLLSRRQPCIERQHLDRPWHRRAPARLNVPTLQLILESLLRIANLALTGQEHQNVARALREQLLARLNNARDLVNRIRSARSESLG